MDKDSIYIADSALITKDNLAVLQSQKVRFISRLPETYSMAEEVKQWAWKTRRWITLGAVSQKKNASQYQAQSTIRELDGQRYRFITFHSSNLDARKEKTITRRIEKEREKLEKDCRELGKRVFYCKADAQPEMEITYRIEAEVQTPIEELIADLRAKASTFILMTNILGEQELSTLDILKEYKEQTAVEVRFRFLKDPTFIDGIYVKNPARVMALGYIFLMALLIFSLLERRVRKNLKKENGILIIPGKKKSDSPTGTMILAMLSSMYVARFIFDNLIVRKLPKNLINNQIRKLLVLAGFDETIYLEPKKRSRIST